MRADEFRKQFPSLVDTVHLASCSQGAVSEHLSATMGELAYSLRSQGAPWGEWMAEVDRAREGFARLVRASPDEVALVPSASVGAFQVASVQDFAERNHIVCMAGEFPSVGNVFAAQCANGATVRWVSHAAMAEHGVVEAYREQIDETTRLVSVPLALYSNGSVQPVNAIAKHARAMGARVFVDAYQAAGVLPIDVTRLDCDYLVTGSLKYLLGLPGAAFVFAREGVTDQREPQLTGWFGRVDPFAFDPKSLDFPAAARRFESGTPAVPAVYAARAGLDVLAKLDHGEVQKHVSDLVAGLGAKLVAAGESLSLPATDAVPGPQVALLDADPDNLAAYLQQRRIVTAARGSILRMSFHYYNSWADVDAVVQSISDYRRKS